MNWTPPSPVLLSTAGRRVTIGRDGLSGSPPVAPTLFSQVLLLCQDGGLKLALNGQGLGATSLGQQNLEQLRELRISGSVQLYCVHC